MIIKHETKIQNLKSKVKEIYKFYNSTPQGKSILKNTITFKSFGSECHDYIGNCGFRIMEIYSNNSFNIKRLDIQYNVYIDNGVKTRRESYSLIENSEDIVVLFEPKYTDYTFDEFINDIHKFILGNKDNL